MRNMINAIAALCIVATLLSDPALSAKEPDGTQESPVPGAASWSGICTPDEWEVLRLTNKIRAENGAEPVSTFGDLQTAAHTRAGELHTHFSHERPDGSSCFSVLEEVGLSYATAAENIAYGHTSAANVALGWAESPGHFQNMINAGLTHLSTGYDGGVDRDGNAWAQLFLDYVCDLTLLRVELPDSGKTCAESIDALGGVVVMECDKHGLCYLPLTEELVSGFDSECRGEQSVSVNCYGQSLPVTVAVDAVSAAMQNFTLRAAYTPGMYTDVDEDAWYSRVVAEAVQLGIMDGVASGSFEPMGYTTIAQTVKIACVLHAVYNGGDGAFAQGSPWYRVYLDYAEENGILAAGEFSGRYHENATRAEVAHILAKALPAAALEQMNEVASLPDVDIAGQYGAEIFLLYRAGVLTGNDEYGAFVPESSIRRAETAAFIARMALPEERRAFTLTPTV